MRAGLYTDESPGLKVDPFVVMVLSIGFIISVVALHSTYRTTLACFEGGRRANISRSHREGHQTILVVA